MPLVRSISGLRATLGDALSPRVVVDYAAAFATMLPAGAIVVGRDGRPSGQWIESLVIAALQSCGREIRQLGIVPTPTVQLLTEHSDAAGGIVITASHNPAPWNGLKFLAGDGTFLDADQNAKLWDILDNNSMHYSSEQQAGLVVCVDDAILQHINRILALPLFDEATLGRIRSKPLKVVVDAVNCSGSSAVPALMRTLGAEVVELYCDGSGVFPHTPEPLTENLTELCAAVRAHKADLGIAVDPDADRLVIIDERGEAIGEEKTVVLAIEAVMRNRSAFQSSGDAVAVVNLSTSRMAVDAAEAHGGRCELSAVGEINVVRAMQAAKAIVGGEGSGGVIVPACHFGRDSLVGIALVVWLRAHTSADEWSSLLHSQAYSMLKFKQEVRERPTEWHTDLTAQELEQVRVNYSDGIRVDWPRQWVQLRASNTEPIVRCIAEAPSKAEAQALIDRALGWLKS